ncbi:MAG: hypothetical protein HFF69_11680 [Oscillospiraceae bacterium]|jgi:hypothetical protein|nr:hypothetical protein [Oscillospiraceae bacterium]MDE7009978.1 hypothetical protein [Oscillospiraceae bacterium]
MSNIYEWLFDCYALPKLRSVESSHDDALSAFAERVGLPGKTRLLLHDMVSNMRLELGVEAFALGIRFGLRLSSQRTRRREPGWLLDFLPQLDDPVP